MDCPTSRPSAEESFHLTYNIEPRVILRTQIAHHCETPHRSPCRLYVPRTSVAHSNLSASPLALSRPHLEHCRPSRFYVAAIRHENFDGITLPLPTFRRPHSARLALPRSPPIQLLRPDQKAGTPLLPLPPPLHQTLPYVLGPRRRLGCHPRLRPFHDPVHGSPDLLVPRL